MTAVFFLAFFKDILEKYIVKIKEDFLLVAAQVRLERTDLLVHSDSVTSSELQERLSIRPS